MKLTKPAFARMARSSQLILVFDGHSSRGSWTRRTARNDGMGMVDRHALVPLLGLSAAVAAGAVVAIGPWGRCGVTEGRLDAFLLHHPRVEFLLMLPLCLAVAFGVARGVSAVARDIAPWCLIPVALAAWIIFEAKAAYVEALPRSLLEYRGSILWVPLCALAFASATAARRRAHDVVSEA
jgi:hypothetical protein